MSERAQIAIMIEQQQMALLTAAGPLFVSGAFLGIAILVFLLKDQQPWLKLSVWGGLQSLVTAITIFSMLRLRSQLSLANTRQWQRYWMLLAGVTGGGWGTTPWIFLPAPLGFDRDASIVVGAMVCIVASAGAAGFVYHRQTFVSWIVGSLVVGAVGFLRLGQPLQLVLGAGLAGLGGIVLHQNFAICKRILDSLRLAIENQVLVEDKVALLSELQERTRTAEQAKEKAEEASVVRLRFLSAASHDLRQPVHVIGLRASELLERIQYPEVRSIVEKIVQSTETLEERFDAILGAAQLQMGRTKPKIDDFPVSQLLSRIDTSYAPQAHAHGLVFEVHSSAAIVRTDLNLLTSLVGNFVSNAIRYTRTGKVLVRCRERGDVARVQVWDSGPGIKRSEFKAIFEEFVRLDHPGMQSRERGHGMGLAIVRGLAEALGLRIGVRSKVGKGSLFWVELPLIGNVLADTGGHDLSLLQGSEKIAGSFVVVIDDEEEVLSSHRSLLRQWGCHVVAATTAQGALRELESHERIPDLLLCDYQLGGGQTGIEAIKAIRAAQGHEIPAIILTGDITVVDQLQSALTQCNVITKPLRASKLRPALLHSLGLQ